MALQLNTLTIKRFKRVETATFDLKAVNVLVGGNNSGKSSIIQGLHFLISVLQSIDLLKKWPSRGSATLSPQELIYSPSDDPYDLSLGTKMQTKKENAIYFDAILSDGSRLETSIYKGKNVNIAVQLSDTEVAKKLSRLDLPFSVFSPGLAGIAKRENFVSDGVLLRALARGDANLYLRNIILRLWDKPKWPEFIEDLRYLFGGLDISVSYEPNIDEYVDVFVSQYGSTVPLELSGTGILQALQILAYTHQFAPSMVILDEPDSHLHPNNQRLICGLLERIATDRDIQVVMTTHSRHVVDELALRGNFLWVQKGGVTQASSEDSLAILMDLGALDIRERLSENDVSLIVLTEDSIPHNFRNVLISNDIDLNDTLILSYNGVTELHRLGAILDNVRQLRPDAKILLHRDRDYLTDEEIEEWAEQVRGKDVTPFVPPISDVESMMLGPAYLHEKNTYLSEIEAEEVLSTAAEELKPVGVRDYVNGRIEVLRKRGDRVDAGQLAADANAAIEAKPRRFIQGKKLLKAVRRIVRDRYDRNLTTGTPSDLLRTEDLGRMAARLRNGGG